jgi:hypothetical protein
MTHDERTPGRSDAAIDAVLRGWRRRQDDAADAAGRIGRIAAAVRAADMTSAGTVVAVPSVRWGERTGWFAAGLAVAALVACVVWSVGRPDAAVDWPPSVRFAAADLAARSEVLAGMEQTFAGRLAWLAEHDDTVAVGLATDAVAPAGQPVAVRLVVLARRGAAAEWEPVWQTDLVVRDEQVVDVAAGSHGDGRLRLWAHCLPDGAVAVDGELTLAARAVPLRASYGGVQKPGLPRRVTGDRAADVEWQVIQTVVPLRTAAAKEVG